jgi:hypothetical protein
MNRRPWSGLVLSVIVLTVALLPATTISDSTAKPWPAMLSAEPADIDPGVAVLQRRAHVALAKLVEAAQSSN